MNLWKLKNINRHQWIHSLSLFVEFLLIKGIPIFGFELDSFCVLSDPFWRLGFKDEGAKIIACHEDGETVDVCEFHWAAQQIVEFTTKICVSVFDERDSPRCVLRKHFDVDPRQRLLVRVGNLELGLVSEKENFELAGEVRCSVLQERPVECLHVDTGALEAQWEGESRHGRSCRQLILFAQDYILTLARLQVAEVFRYCGDKGFLGEKHLQIYFVVQQLHLWVHILQGRNNVVIC